MLFNGNLFMIGSIYIYIYIYIYVCVCVCVCVCVHQCMYENRSKEWRVKTKHFYCGNTLSLLIKVEKLIMTLVKTSLRRGMWIT